MAMMGGRRICIMDYRRRGGFVGDYVLIAFIVMLIIYVVFAYVTYQATPQLLLMSSLISIAAARWDWGGGGVPL